MDMDKLFGWLAVFLLMMPLGFAQTIDQYSISHQIVGNDAFVSQDIKLTSSDKLLELEIPDDAEELTLDINDRQVQINVTEGKLQIPLDDLTKYIKVTYISSHPTETKDEFLADIKMPADVKNLEVKVILPEEAVLRKPVSEGGSIFPAAKKVETDGLQIFITWTAQNLKKDDRFGAFVLYKGMKTMSSAWYLVGALIVVIAVLLIRKRRKVKAQKKIAGKSGSKPTKHAHEDVSSHLKDDEKQIVNVLKQRDGQCEQGTLRVVTGIPKATLSRLLMELEARNVVYKEKKGKKNIVFLK